MRHRCEFDGPVAAKCFANLMRGKMVYCQFDASLTNLLLENGLLPI
jgi:hypothetical protein